MRIFPTFGKTPMAVDTGPAPLHRRHRHRASASVPTRGLVARSPIEQAIAEQKDRRAKYERSMREQGFERKTLWAKSDDWPQVRHIVRCLNATNGGFRADILALLEKWEQRG